MFSFVDGRIKEKWDLPDITTPVHVILQESLFIVLYFLVWKGYFNSVQMTLNLRVR